MASSDGTIWVGTPLDGLYRYDGTTWTAEDEFSGRSITALMESTDGVIWVGTQFNGLRYHDGTTWIAEDRLDGMLTTSLLESTDGTIWVGTQFNGLHHYDETTWKIQKELSGKLIMSLLESADGKIWTGVTGKGLYCYDGITWKSEDELNVIMINSLLESSDGTIWIGTQLNGLHRYDGTTWKVEEPLSGIPVTVLLESTDRVIWAGTENGLSRYNGISWTTEELLSGMPVTALLESTDRVIWVGMKYGLYRYDGINWTAEELLVGMQTRALLESADGMIWAGTDNGLLRYDGTTWAAEEALSGVLIHSLLKSVDGTIWVGTEDGLWIYDGTTWSTLTVSDGLPSDWIFAILEDSDGNMWFGTMNGIVMYNPNDNPPLIKITNPQVQAILTGAASLFIEWIAGDVETKIDRLAYQHKVNDGAWSVPIQFAFTTLTELNDGKNIFYVRAIDRDRNKSEPATLTIIVDTIRPNVLIANPAPDAIVGGIVQITGGVTDTDLAEFRVEYAEGEEPSEDDFKLIGQLDRAVASGVLAEWDTKSLPEKFYIIKLSARDKLEHTKDYSITVTLDNTPPNTKLIAPQDGSRLTKQTEIIGEVSDKHLDGYVLEYTTDSDPNTALWWQIFKTPESLTENKVSIHQDWEVPTITGTIFIRLTAIDAAGNTDQQIVSVEVPQAVTKDKGGDASSSDGNAQIYIPPRSLLGDTIITINSVPEQEWEGEAPAELSWQAAYDFEPFDLQFNQKPYKPATITMRYPVHLLEFGKTLAIYRFQKKESVSSGVKPPNNGGGFGGGTVVWVSSERLGGTLDSSNKTITSATTRLGRFVLMQEPKPTSGDDAKITQLTCQPRIFSPKGGGFDTRTAISFNLTKNVRVTIKVYNRSGKLKRLLEENKEMPEGVNVVFWDGRDDDNNIVRSDLYIVTVTVGDMIVTKTVAVSNR